MPEVSIIVPCFNEESTIAFLLNAIYSQTYHCSQIEVIISDGLSTDGTRQAIRIFQENHPDLEVKIINNPQKTIPSGLNQAIKSSRGSVIIRLDAHSIPSTDYVTQCLSALKNGLGDNVGGIWEINPGGIGWIARSIALAAAHPLGAGDARYRLGGKAQEVDTVPFGAYFRSLIDKIGYYNESLLTNEDYEFNVRIRNFGGRVWFDPSIRSCYFARANFSQLAKQYWRYGYWKAKMLKRYPKTIRWRQLAPPLFVVTILLLGIIGFILPSSFCLLSSLLFIYGLIVIISSLQVVCRSRDLSLALGFPIAIIIMHFGWGISFLWSILTKR